MKYEIEEFCCECSLMSDALDTLFYIYNHKRNKFSSVSVIANEELTEAIIKFLISEFNVKIDYIYFDKDDCSDAYGIVLTLEDGELHLSVEQSMGNDRYKTFFSDYIYVSDEIDDIEEFIEYQADDSEIDVFEILNDCE